MVFRLMQLNNLKLFFIILQLLTVNTLSKVQTEVLKREQVVVEGQDVHFSCERLARMSRGMSGSTKLTWENSDGILFAEKSGFLTSSRINLTAVKFQKYNLEIRKVTTSDSGTYRCLLYHGNETYKVVYVLKVTVPPSFKSTSKDTYIKEGGSGVLSCEVGGLPTPEVSWRFIMPQVDEVRNTGQFYVISKASRNLGGRYVCLADNGVGPPIQHEIKLTVLYPPEILADEGSEERGDIVSGEKSSLTCVGRGEPAPKFKWRLPNKQVITKDRKWRGHFLTVSRSGQITRSTLHVNRAEASDAGLYVCIACNSQGSANRTLLAEEKTMPVTRPPPFHHFTTSGSSGNSIATARRKWELLALTMALLVAAVVVI